MERARRPIRYLGADEIIGFNRSLVLQTGGLTRNAGKAINPGSLDYLTQIVREQRTEDPLRRVIAEKAAIYAYNIITRHVFFDGNKRTGMACAFFFLRLNGYELSSSLSCSDIVKVAVDIAKGEMDLPSLRRWFEERIA